MASYSYSADARMLPKPKPSTAGNIFDAIKLLCDPSAMCLARKVEELHTKLCLLKQETNRVNPYAQPVFCTGIVDQFQDSQGDMDQLRSQIGKYLQLLSEKLPRGMFKLFYENFSDDETDMKQMYNVTDETVEDGNKKAIRNIEGSYASQPSSHSSSLFHEARSKLSLGLHPIVDGVERLHMRKASLIEDLESCKLEYNRRKSSNMPPSVAANLKYAETMQEYMKQKVKLSSKISDGLALFGDKLPASLVSRLCQCCEVDEAPIVEVIAAKQQQQQEDVKAREEKSTRLDSTLFEELKGLGDPNVDIRRLKALHVDMVELKCLRDKHNANLVSTTAGKEYMLSRYNTYRDQFDKCKAEICNYLAKLSESMPGGIHERLCKHFDVEVPKAATRSDLQIDSNLPGSPSKDPNSFEAPHTDVPSKTPLESGQNIEGSENFDRLEYFKNVKDYQSVVAYAEEVTTLKEQMQNELQQREQFKTEREAKMASVNSNLDKEFVTKMQEYHKTFLEEGLQEFKTKIDKLQVQMKEKLDLMSSSVPKDQLERWCMHYGINDGSGKADSPPSHPVPHPSESEPISGPNNEVERSGTDTATFGTKRKFEGGRSEDLPDKPGANLTCEPSPSKSITIISEEPLFKRLSSMPQHEQERNSSASVPQMRPEDVREPFSRESRQQNPFVRGSDNNGYGHPAPISLTLGTGENRSIGHAASGQRLYQEQPDHLANRPAGNYSRSTQELLPSSRDVYAAYSDRQSSAYRTDNYSSDPKIPNSFRRSMPPASSDYLYKASSSSLSSSDRPYEKYSDVSPSSRFADSRPVSGDYPLSRSSLWSKDRATEDYSLLSRLDTWKPGGVSTKGFYRS